MFNGNGGNSTVVISSTVVHSAVFRLSQLDKMKCGVSSTVTAHIKMLLKWFLNSSLFIIHITNEFQLSVCL